MDLLLAALLGLVATYLITGFAYGLRINARFFGLWDPSTFGYALKETSCWPRLAYLRLKRRKTFGILGDRIV